MMGANPTINHAALGPAPFHHDDITDDGPDHYVGDMAVDDAQLSRSVAFLVVAAAGVLIAVQLAGVKASVQLSAG